MPLLGCSGHLYSPPGKLDVVESVATLAQGQLGASAEGAVRGEAFGPNFASGIAKARYGLSDTVELSGGVAALSVVREDGEMVPTSLNNTAYGARVGAKKNVENIVAVSGGLGGGASEAGGFIGPDVRLTLAYENRYFVPFASAGFAISFPVASRTVDFGPIHGVQKPETTFYPSLTLGAKLPLSGWNAPDERPPPVALGVALDFTGAHDRAGSDTFVGLALGLDFAF